MQKYVDRLIKCGYSEDEANELCESFVRNFTLVELEFFVSSMEKNDVGRV